MIKYDINNMPIDQPPPYRRTLLLDITGDICFDGSGKLCMTATDAEKREQDIYIYIKTVVGEDIFDTNYGFDIVGAKESPFNPARIEYEIRATIEQYRNRFDRPNRIKEISRVFVDEPSVDRILQVSVAMVADTNSVSALSLDI